ALRSSLALGRRDVFVRAQRAVARQRPARRAPLLHRLSRFPPPHRLRSPTAAATAAARAGAARGKAAVDYLSGATSSASSPCTVAPDLRAAFPSGTRSRPQGGECVTQARSRRRSARQ